MKSIILVGASILLLSFRALAQPHHDNLLYSDMLASPNSTVFFIQNNDGEFLSGKGWQATDVTSQLYIQLPENLPYEGTLVIDVTNFNPVQQNQSEKQQIINLYSRREGSKEVFDTDASWWNIRTGTNYSLGEEGMAGFKFLSAPRSIDSREETRCIEDKSNWDLNAVYEFKVTWTAKHIYCFFENQLAAEFNFAGQDEAFQYIFLGTDNVYQAQPGPIYSNLRIYGVDENSADISFTDVTKNYKAEGYSESGYGHGVSFADVNQDGRYDLFVANAIREQKLPDMLYINKDGWFSEQAKNRGVQDWGLTHSIVSADIDNDGDLDAFFADMSIYPDKHDGLGRNALYRNDNGNYTDISNWAGISNELNDTRGAIALDINNDGRLDLYGANWGQPCEMYLNQGDGRMTRVNRGAAGPDGDTSEKQGVTAADFDNDGDIDIYVCRREADNWLFINDGNGYFTERADDYDVDVGGRSHGATFADIDNDADLDLFVVNFSPYGGGSPPLMNVFINNGDGTFVERTDDFNIRVSGYSVSFGDVDNDADLDMFLLCNDEKEPGATPKLFLNDNGHFEQKICGVEVPARDARAVGYADIDNDGDIDFYLTAKYGRNYLLRNDLDSDNYYIDILCTGPRGDYGGFGSKVIVYEPGYLGSPNHILGCQESVSNYAYLCQNQTALHFGLRHYATCDIRIIRTDGQVFDYRAVSGNQFFIMDDHEPALFNLLYMLGDGQNNTAGAPLDEPFVVRVVDQTGAGVGGAEVTFTPQNGGYMLEPQPVLTDARGYAESSFVLGENPGQYAVTAVSNYTDDAQIVFHAQADERTVHILKNYGDGQSGVVGQTLASPVVVFAAFENGDPASNIPVEFHVGENSGYVEGTLTHSALTDDDGKARVVWTLGEISGANYLFARYKNTELQFTATALPDQAATIVADSLDFDYFQTGKKYPVSCRVFDQFGNAVPDARVDFVVAAGHGSLDGFSHQAVHSDADGHAAVAWMLGNHTLENILKAKIATDSVFIEIENVHAPLLTNSAISARDSIAADGIDSTLITIQLKNEDDLALPYYYVEFHVSGTGNWITAVSDTTDSLGVVQAILKSTTAETKQITASAPDVGVIPDSIKVHFYTPPPLGVHLIKVSADSQVVVAGHDLAPLIVRVVDENGDPVADREIHFDFSNDQAHVDGDSIIIHSDENGDAQVRLQMRPIIRYRSMTVIVSLIDSHYSVSFDIFIEPDSPASISRLSSDSLTVDPGDSVALAVKVRDQFGNNTPHIPVLFSSDKDVFIGDRPAVTDSNGIARTTAMMGRGVGWHKIEAMTDSVTISFYFYVKQQPEHLVKIAPDTILVTHDNETVELFVKCLDPDDSPVADVTVEFLRLDGFGAFAQPAINKSNVDGLASTLWRSSSQSRLTTIQATSIHDSVRFYIKFDAETLVDGQALPLHFVLGDNYPNPFNPTTSIPISVPNPTLVTLQIFNVKGQLVRTLVDGMMQAGQHVVVFDMLDDRRRSLPSGVYFYRMTAGDFEARKRLLLMK